MIRIQNLYKNYGPTRAVNNLNVDIPKGEILGFLGPNGAGKSTSLRMVTGYLPPTSGSVEVYGNDVAQKPASRQGTYGLPSRIRSSLR